MLLSIIPRNTSMRTLASSLLTLILLSGCGPSEEVLDKQDEKWEATLEEQMVDPPGMSGRDKEARRLRLQLQYGPEAVERYDQKNREKASK